MTVVAKLAVWVCKIHFGLRLYVFLNLIVGSSILVFTTEEPIKVLINEQPSLMALKPMHGSSRIRQSECSSECRHMRRRVGP